MSVNSYDQDLKLLKEWLLKQPHLPKKIHDNFLKQFLHTCAPSIEKAKQVLDLNLTIRSQIHEIFSNRDPLRPEIKTIHEITDMLWLPKVTKDRYKIAIYRLRDSDVKKFNLLEILRTFFSLADVRLIFETDYLQSDGEIAVFDMDGLSLKHVSKCPIYMVKNFILYLQEAHPLRPKQVHVLNTPSFVDSVFPLLKPFMRSNTLQIIHFHTRNSNTFFEYVPKDLLPQEYGGTLGTVDEIKDYWKKIIMEYRSYLLEDDRWKVDETKRIIENNTAKELLGIQGSFKALEVD